VRMRGTTNHLNDFKTSSLSIDTAFGKVTQPGLQYVALSVTNNDPDVELDSAPSSISVFVDQLSSQQLPVSVVPMTTTDPKTGKEVTLKPPPGYQMEDTTATPAQVTVTGSSHRLASIQRLHAQAEVDLSNAKTTYAATVDVVLRDATGTRISDLELDTPVVQVQIVITSNKVTRASAVVPDLTGTVGFGRVLTGVIVTPKPFVILSGPQDLLNTLDSVPTDAVNLSSLGSGQKVTRTVQVPQGVTADPSTVEIQVFFSFLPPPTPTPLPTPVPTPVPTATPAPTPTPTPTPAPPTPTPTP
jgi:YbbR domain-containing protein